MAQKKMKDIFTHEMGQILFPGQPTVIETRKISPGTDITMKNTRPQIALTPYGAAQMNPNQNYSFAGNTVVELPTAQMGAQAGGDGQQAQIMQIIQMYAQLKGVDPNQLVQELQALPQEEQQKSFELMIGEVQTAMAQQQQAAQQPQDQQAMGMPMARNGGLTMHQIKGVVDSMVKDAIQRYMSGGEAFPQANKYPEQWVGYNGTQYAEGGEPCIDCFDKYNPSPQAQTYLPYDRKGEKRPNFMFMDGGSKDEFGGQPDLDSIYRMMRSGGLAVNAKKKRGESLSPEEFQEYLSGGSLKEFQGTTQSTTGITAGNTMTGISPTKFQSPEAFGQRLNTIMNQGKQDMFKYSGLTEDEKRIAQTQERINESQPTGLASLPTRGDLREAMSPADNTTTPSSTTTTQQQKPGTGVYKSFPGIHPATYLTAMNTAMGGKGSALGLLGNLASLVADFATPPMAGVRQQVPNPYQGLFEQYLNKPKTDEMTTTPASTSLPAAAASRTPIVPPGSTISTSTASPKTSTNQSVTDGNVNDFINAGNKRFDRNLDLRDNKGIFIYSGDQTDPGGTFGPTSGALDRAIFSADDVVFKNTQKANNESINKAYDILNNSDKYSPEEIAKANEIIDARINDWSSENASQFNISGGPQLTTGPRGYRKGGKKKALPKAQFALPGDVTAAGVAGPTSSAMNTVGQMRAQQLAAPGALEEFDFENQGPVATPSAGAPVAKGPQMEPITMAPMRTISSVTPSTPAPEMQPKMSSQDLGPAGLTNRQIRQEDRNNRRELRQDWKDFKKTDEYKDARKQQRKNFWSDPNAGFDHAKAARMVAATQGIGDFFKVGNQEYMEDQLKKMGLNTSANLGVSQGRDRGDFMANTGRFRPDDYTEAQDAGRSMTDQTSFYNTFNKIYNAKMGGRILDFLEDGGVYELDEDTIRLIMEAGGSVEYI